MKSGKAIRIAVGIICLLAAVAIAVYVFLEYYKRSQADKAMKELVPETTVEEPAPEPEPESEEPVEESEAHANVPNKDIDWNALHEANPHIYAWVSVPGTAIEYPVLQHPEDDYFYLNHNMDGSSGYPGCIYSEKEYNGQDFSDPVTVLYGHNMKNGTMFRGLHDFENLDFFNGDNYIYIYTPEKNYAYQIFSAYELDDRHLLAGWNFEAENALPIYEDAIMADAKGHFKDIEITNEDKLIILSTCANGGRNEIRYMIQGKFIGSSTNQEEESEGISDSGQEEND